MTLVVVEWPFLPRLGQAIQSTDWSRQECLSYKHRCEKKVGPAPAERATGGVDREVASW